jgi:hypothetical protein
MIDGQVSYAYRERYRVDNTYFIRYKYFTMPKRIVNIFISTLLLLAFSGEALDLSIWAEVSVCPDSSFSDCYDDDCLLRERLPYLSAPTLCLALVSVSTLLDQGFVKSIFHPPTSLL